MRGSPGGAARRAACLAGCLAGLLGGCSGAPKPVEACVTFTSGSNLHTYDGQPHVLPVYVYALISSIEFRQTDVSTLLAEQIPEGVVGGPLELIVAPDSVVEFHEALDPRTLELGIVADYYRSPQDPPGSRKAVVPASCGMFGGAKIRLTPTDLLVE